MVLVSDKPNNDIGILQTKLSDRERHETRHVGLEAMPLDEDIEGGHGEREPRLEIRPAPVHDLFEMADERQHREHRLHQHPVLPLPPLTQFAIGRIALGRMEAGITQDNHLLLTLPNQPLKRVIGDIGRATVPPHHQAILVQQQTEFTPDNPAMVGQAFAPDLLGAAAFAYGEEPLNPLGVDDAQDRRRGEEDLRPVLMRLEEAKEPRALGEVGKQRPIVARQPAIEGPVAHAFERMQHSQGAHLTGPEVRLGVFGDGAQLLIDLVEQGRDKLHGAHTALLSWEGCHREQRGGVVERLQVQKREPLVCTVLCSLYGW